MNKKNSHCQVKIRESTEYYFLDIKTKAKVTGFDKLRITLEFKSIDLNLISETSLRYIRRAGVLVVTFSIVNIYKNVLLNPFLNNKIPITNLQPVETHVRLIKNNFTTLSGLKKIILNKIDQLFLNNDIKNITYDQIYNLIYQEIFTYLSYNNLSIVEKELLDTYFLFKNEVFFYINTKYLKIPSYFASSTGGFFPFTHGGLSGRRHDNSLNVPIHHGQQLFIRNGHQWEVIEIAYDSPLYSGSHGLSLSKSSHLLSPGVKARSLVIPQARGGQFYGPGEYVVRMDQLSTEVLGFNLTTYRNWNINNFEQDFTRVPELNSSGVYVWQVENAFHDGDGIYVGKALSFFNRMTGEWNAMSDGTCQNELDLCLYNTLRSNRRAHETNEPILRQGQHIRRRLTLHFITAGEGILDQNTPLCEALESLVIDAIVYNREFLIEDKLRNPFWRRGVNGRPATTIVSFLSNKAKNPAFQHLGMRSDWFQDHILNFQDWTDSMHERFPERNMNRLQRCRLPGRHPLHEFIRTRPNDLHYITNDRFASELYARLYRTKPEILIAGQSVSQYVPPPR